MLRLYVLLITTGFLTPVSATAQEASQMGLGVRFGQLVRVRLAQGQLLEGRYGEVPLGTASIDSLWVRGNRAKTGALIGGLVFGVGSAVLGKVGCDLASDGHGCQEPGRVVAFSAVGAAVGVGIGALIGSAVGTWRLGYARSGARIRVSPVVLNRIRLDVRLPL